MTWATTTPLTESEIDPHAEPFDPGIDREAAEIPEGQSLPPPPSIMKGAGRIRITQQDLVKNGFSNDCRRCADLEACKHLTKESHSEECRLRIYSERESHKDPKWALARRELQLEEIGTSLPSADIEIEGIENLDARKPRAGIPHPKSTARNSDDVHDDANISAMVDDGVDREAFPDDLSDDTMLIDVPGTR